LLEELVLRGFAPTVGIVSVFDSDYEAARRYELEVVSAPPFQAFPAEALEQHAALARRAHVIIVAPVFFGPGNLEPLRETLRAARSGKNVFVLRDPPIEQRDLSGGEATALMNELTLAGALFVSEAGEAVELVQAQEGAPTGDQDPARNGT
jgi:iron complex transport system ATP-binding protein